MTVDEKRKNKLQVLFSDASIVVVDKPSGIDVLQVASETGGILVHRLDKDTSGVMVLAKNSTAELNLKKQFEERKVIKKYLALVHGEMKEKGGLITTPVQRYPKDKLRSAITEWKVIQKYPQYSVLELMPHTGRTHQLRQHLKSIGHPIVADPIYGFRKKLKDDLAWCPRLFLHAKYLEITHPTTFEMIHFQADLPEALQNLLH